MTTPPRRHLRYSLRTLFVVVTVLCLLIGWQVQTVRQREIIRNWIVDGGGSVDPPASVILQERRLRVIYQADPAIVNLSSVPVWRIWLGDSALGVILMPEASSEADLVRTKKAFPEMRRLLVPPKRVRIRTIAPDSVPGPVVTITVLHPAGR